jgi:uncharacterized protein (DUF3820 family)
MIIQTFYISTGRKNAMYTLRARRDTVGQQAFMADFMPDYYICNLAATPELAAEKATLYFEAMQDRITQSEHFKMILDTDPEQEAFKRRGKLSTYDTIKLNKVEEGYFPFGKHVDTKIIDAPDSYILYFADKATEVTEPVLGALVAACMGVALERGLIAKREAIKAERMERDMLSNFIGTVGSRIDFEGELLVCFQKDDGYGGSYWINKVYCNNNIVVYMGSKSLGDKGSVVKFRATIKKHSEYQGIKTTQVSRPS